jgi:hypothetical protein
MVKLTPEMQAALRLWSSVVAGTGAEADPWATAIRLDQLLDVGLTQCDLRWLVTKGYVRQAREVTVPGDAVRRFQPGRNLAFNSETRFLLTDAGASLAGRQDAARTRTETNVTADQDRGVRVLQIPTSGAGRHRPRKAA